LADVKKQFHFYSLSMRLQEQWLVDSENFVAIVGVVIFFFAPERNKGVLLGYLVFVWLFCELGEDACSYFGTDGLS
jgi:hypothetical protein